ASLEHALSVVVAVERGVEVADHFDLCGKILLAQKRTLIGQRNPEFPYVAENLAPDWINRDPERPFAVRRLLPWVHLRHGASYRFEARCTVTLLLTASVRFRTFAGGFPHSPQRPMGKTCCVAPPAEFGRRLVTCASHEYRSAQSQMCFFQTG